MGLSIKDVRSRVEGVCPVRTFCGGFLRYGRLHFLVEKNFKIYGVSARTSGEGSIFRDFVRTAFMDGPYIKIYGSVFYFILSKNRAFTISTIYQNSSSIEHFLH